MDALGLAFGTASFDAACSSHLIEHFTDPESHVAELARVLKDGGLACVLTPNKPADFENPFHLHLFERDELRTMLERHFGDVWLGGVDAAPHVKADFEARRIRRARCSASTPSTSGTACRQLGGTSGRTRGCCRWPTGSWPGQDTGGATGITADDWFVTDDPDDTTLVLFAVARLPRRGSAR